MKMINEPCEKGLLIMVRKCTVFLIAQLYDMSVCKYTVTNVITQLYDISVCKHTITNVTILQKFEFKSDKI
jgi:hypothetical protein